MGKKKNFFHRPLYYFYFSRYYSPENSLIGKSNFLKKTNLLTLVSNVGSKGHRHSSQVKRPLCRDRKIKLQKVLASLTNRRNFPPASIWRVNVRKMKNSCSSSKE
jgi:hypothetical protein